MELKGMEGRRSGKCPSPLVCRNLSLRSPQSRAWLNQHLAGVPGGADVSHGWVPQMGPFPLLIIVITEPYHLFCTCSQCDLPEVSNWIALSPQGAIQTPRCSLPLTCSSVMGLLTVSSGPPQGPCMHASLCWQCFSPPGYLFGAQLQ